MRYYKQISDNRIIAIGTGDGGAEITEEEYNILLAEIRQKASLVDRLYFGEITIDNVPVDWQEEIRRRADERRDADAQAQEEEAGIDELAQALEAIL